MSASDQDTTARTATADEKPDTDPTPAADAPAAGEKRRAAAPREAVRDGVPAEAVSATEEPEGKSAGTPGGEPGKGELAAAEPVEGAGAGEEHAEGTALDTDDDAEHRAGDADGTEVDETEADEDGASDEDEPAEGMTPKQARRLRVAAASVLLVAMAAVLVVRLASRTSVLVVGVYGLAMILCGVVIELSRNGRTRLGTWLLVGGLAAALAFDWLILP
ncbi:hypothetical protein ACFXA4_11280 [Streptomyces sp. NPDC059442]|uniref:hypothetical protein n=1 Tax=Streptomyces sp. NPDC059442 TaxID=3346830 RepID=UPI0036B4F47D